MPLKEYIFACEEHAIDGTKGKTGKFRWFWYVPKLFQGTTKAKKFNHFISNNNLVIYIYISKKYFKVIKLIDTFN